MATEKLGEPSYEERTLMALRERDFDVVADRMLDDLRQGESPRVLSFARPDLAIGVSQALWPLLSQGDSRQPVEGYKTELFNSLLPAASEGDPAAIGSLPKLATSVSQLATATELLLDNREAVAEWRTGIPYIQFIGSFNPQHIGHRTAIARTLDVAGSRSAGIVQVVENHPIKKDSLPPYRTRFNPGEQKVYSSNLLDINRVHHPDVPLGLGLAKIGIAQIQLLADVAGDQPRWQVGSDKFITDVKSVQNGKSLDKAGERFRNVHLYVLRRNTENPDEIIGGVEYVSERFNADITVVPDTEDPLVLSAAASTIRRLRSQGRHEEADTMEFVDIPQELRQRF